MVERTSSLQARTTTLLHLLPLMDRSAAATTSSTAIATRTTLHVTVIAMSQTSSVQDVLRIMIGGQFHAGGKLLLLERLIQLLELLLVLGLLAESFGKVIVLLLECFLLNVHC